MYRDGTDGLTKDEVRGAALYRQACEGGDVKACWRLAYVYLNGQGVEKDEARAAALYFQACEGGEAAACDDLGLLHLDGRGVEKDEAHATSLFRQACEGGDALGCADLAYAYDTGRGVEKDEAQAVALYRQACEAGEAFPCGALGVLYLEGRGVRRDEGRAIVHFRQACERGETDSCTTLFFLDEKAEQVESAQAPGPAGAKPALVLQSDHTGDIEDLAFSPDGRWLASGSEDMTIKLWEVATGRELRVLGGHKQMLESVAISPDGRWLVSRDLSDVVMLWDVATGRLRHTWPRDAGSLSVAFSPDSRRLAIGREDHTIKIWNLARGREVRTLNKHTDSVRVVAFSPDGKLLASGSQDNTIRLWEVTTGRALHTMAGHSDGVWHVVFSPDGRWLASSGSDKAVKVWEVATGRKVHTWVGHSDYITAIAFSPDARWLLSGSKDQTIKLWDIATGNEVRTLTSDFDGNKAVAFSSDGKLVAWASNRRTVNLRAVTGRELRTPTRSTNLVGPVAYSSDGRWLALGGWDNLVKLWEVSTGRNLRTLEGHDGPVVSLAFSPDGGLLASGSMDRTIRLWEVATGRALRTFVGHSNNVWSVAFSPDGRWLVSGSWDKTAKLWEVATGHEVQTLAGHTDDVFSVAFNSDGSTVATGSMDDTIKLWDTVTGRELRTLAEKRSSGGDRTLSGVMLSVESVAFSPDGSLLASGSADGTIRLWDVATGRVVRKLEGHESWIPGLAFSPDGRWLASSSWDKTIKLWEVATGREVRTLAGHTYKVDAVVFSPDGRWLASASRDGTARIWDPRTGDSVAILMSLRHGTDWLVVAPNGLFDGSPDAWSQILWRFGGNTFDIAPVEIFFNEFYYPGLLADILAGKRPKATQNILEIDRRQPQIRLALSEGHAPASGSISSRTVTVRIEVAEAPADAQRPTGSGARDLRLFRNGSLVKVWRGDLKVDASGKAALQATVPIVAGENRLAAYAFNHDNIKSADATLVVTGNADLKRLGTAYILAVGINRYANPDYNLNFAVADAQAIGEELRSQQAKLGTFARVEAIPLLDSNATKANILLALERLAGTNTGALPPGAPGVIEKIRPTEPEDAVLIYFAGHGANLGPRFYLIPHDLGYSGPRTELDEPGSKLMQAHSISDLELVVAFEKVDAGQLLLLIDACNSGQALEAEEKRRGPMNSKGLAQLAYEKGMYVLTAAQGYQAALEAKALGHGLLTYALVEEGLKTPAADSEPKDGQVAVREWLDYATLRVPQLQEAKIEEAHKQGREIAFVDGEETRGDRTKRSLQRPRVFYRREPEAQPPIIARIPATP